MPLMLGSSPAMKEAALTTVVICPSRADFSVSWMFLIRFSTSVMMADVPNMPPGIAGWLRTKAWMASTRSSKAAALSPDVRSLSVRPCSFTSLSACARAVDASWGFEDPFASRISLATFSAAACLVMGLSRHPAA